MNVAYCLVKSNEVWLTTCELILLHNKINHVLFVRLFLVWANVNLQDTKQHIPPKPDKSLINIYRNKFT